MPGKTYRKKRTTKKPTNRTLNYLVKKVKYLDKIDNCFKRGADMVNVPTIVNLPDTQEINSVGTGMIRDWTNIDESLDSTQARLRQRIQLKRLNVRYQLRVGINSSINEIQRTILKVRVMIVYQKNLPANANNRGLSPGAQYPLIQNLLFANATCSGMDILAHQSWVNKSGFKILYSKVHNLDPMWRNLDLVTPANSVPNQQGDSHAYGTIALDLSKLPPTEFSDAEDGQFAITKGRLMMVAFSDNVVSNANPVIIEYDGIVNYDN